MNYGILFTSWGVGGIFGPMLAGAIADASGSYANAYYIAGGLLSFAAVLGMISYINVSVNLESKQIVISFDKKPAWKKATEVAQQQKIGG